MDRDRGDHDDRGDDSQPGPPHSIARNVYAAGAHTEPTVNPSWLTPWYSPRRAGSDSSA